MYSDTMFLEINGSNGTNDVCVLRLVIYLSIVYNIAEKGNVILFKKRSSSSLIICNHLSTYM